MTLLPRIRVLVVLLSIGAISLPLSVAQQDETAPTAAPKNQSETPSPPTKPSTQTTGQAAPNEGQQKPATGAASQQPTPRVGKTTPRKRKRITPGTTTESGKVVVSNGGAKENAEQLAPAMSKEQELHERENTSELLATTDANLKSIAGRQLTPAQQNMLSQIHSYVSQSKAASDAGDLVRANTLASKAHLLSDELAKK